MKKTITLFTFLLMIKFSFAQTQRMVLVEEFTQASCGPCAAQNPDFNDLLEANFTKAVSIKYQTDWPGTDPMNAQNPSDVQSRVSYYGVSGVPTGLVDGIKIVNDCGSYTGAPSCLEQSEIDDRYAITSPISINVNSHLSSDNDSIYIHIIIKNETGGTLADVATWKVRVAIVEKLIHFSSAPGSNGETDFEMVMRKMLPAAYGTNWTSLAAGASKTYDFNMLLPTYIYDVNEVAALCFVQNQTTRAVQQAGYSEYNVGINELISTGDFKVYPNPASEKVTVEFNVAHASTAKISVTDLLGRTVAENPSLKVVAGLNVTQLDLNQLPAGVYIVSVYDGEKVQQQKISVLKN